MHLHFIYLIQKKDKTKIVPEIEGFLHKLRRSDSLVVGNVFADLLKERRRCDRQITILNSVAPTALKKGYSQKLLLPNCRSYGAFTKENKIGYIQILPQIYYEFNLSYYLTLNKNTSPNR